MPLDTSIYAQFLRPPKSVSDYDREAYDLDRARLGSASAQLELLAGQRQFADQEAKRGAYEQMQQLIRGAGSEEGAIGALRKAGNYDVAGTMEKSMLDRQKLRADASKEAASAAKTYGEAQSGALQRHRDMLPLVSSIGTRDAAAKWLMSQYNDPHIRDHMNALGSLDDAMARIPQGGPELQQWFQQAGMGMDKYMEQQLKEREAAARERNDLIGPDGKPNQAVIAAKKDIARAGSSSSTVSVNTGQKGLDNTLKLRGDFRSEPVYKAHQEMHSAYSQIQQSLKQASPAGDLAGATKIMKLLDPGSVVRESELGMAMAASGLLDRVQNYATNVIKGTKLTPTQRADFLRLADALYRESVNQYNAKRGEYEGIAKRNELPVVDVVGAPSATPGSAAQPPGGNIVNFSDLK
jgi:hypothetical protein